MSTLKLESGRQLIEGSAGQVECQLDLPRNGIDAVRGVALVCHPHPLYGGAMDNKVAWALAKAAAEQSFAAVRFNFRGVGQSAGQHDDGVGETEDASLVLAALSAHFPDLPVVCAGFSFGGAIALRLAAAQRCDLLLTIAPPLVYFDDETPPQPNCPWHLLHSADDEVVAYQANQQRFERWQPQPSVTEVDGAGHFFHGKIGDIKRYAAERIGAEFDRA